MSEGKVAEEYKQESDDALIMVARRNAFYRDRYHFTLGVFFLSLIGTVCLVTACIYLIRHPTRPLYFVADPVSRLLKNIPNTEPNMTLDQVIDWTVEAVEATFTYDFVNYRAQLQNAQKYFSDYGWHRYTDSLSASNNLVALVNRHFVNIGKVTGRPKLLVQGILGGGLCLEIANAFAGELFTAACL